MGKESITLRMEWAKTQCYEFEGFEDNYSLTIKEHSLCRAQFKTQHPPTQT